MSTPFKEYGKYTLWGPNVLNIFFVPLSKPSSAKITWSGSTAVVSAASDSNADGIRVLYRPVGGSLVNGCESAQNKFSCKISGLKKSSGYEFYVVKYRIRGSSRFYGQGTVITNNASASGLTAPKNVILTSTGNKFNVSATKDSNAKGISVLYKQDSSKFALLCESTSSSCSKTLSVNIKNHNYIFYVTQYKVVNNKKVYSPGVISTNMLSPKNLENDAYYAFSDNTEESVYAEELSDILLDYPTDEDLLWEEASSILNPVLEQKSADFSEMTDPDLIELEDFDLGDYEALESVVDEEDDEPINWAELALTEEGTVQEWDDEAEAESETDTETVGKGISAPSDGSSSNATDLYRLGGDDQQATPNVPSFDRP